MTDKPDGTNANPTISSIVMWAILCGASACAGLAITSNPSDTVQRYAECFVVVAGICAVGDLFRRWLRR